MLNFVFILLALFTGSASCRELDLFEKDLVCANRLDELLYLGQAAERGIATQEEPYDGGATQSLARIYIRSDQNGHNVVKAVMGFAILLGWKRSDLNSETELAKKVMVTPELGQAILARKGPHVIQVRFAHVGNIAVAILRTNQITEVDPFALSEFIGEFHRPPQ